MSGGLPGVASRPRLLGPCRHHPSITSTRGSPLGSRACQPAPARRGLAGADVRAWLALAGLRRLCTWETQVTQRGEGCPCARLNGGPHPRAPFSPSFALWGLVVAQQEMDRRVQGPEREPGSAGLG